MSGVEGVVGDSAFFSLSLASSPSTRFRRASSTSVLGPRFFGTASGSKGRACQLLILLRYCAFEDPSKHTIDTRALENLASFA